MNREQTIDRLWERAAHGTRREDVHVAYEAGASEERERWVTLLRSWVVEAERESGPEAAGWLERAIEELAPTTKCSRA